MNIKKFIILSIINSIFFSSLYSQDTKQDKIKRYLMIKGVIEEFQPNSLGELESALIGIQKALSDKENNSYYKFSSYFNRRGIDFYKYSTTGRSIGYNYVAIAGIDSTDHVFIKTDPVITTNEIARRDQGCDTSSFLDYVYIYDKLEFCNRHIQFLDKYDSKMFGPLLNYWEYNRVAIDTDGSFNLKKLFREENEETTEIYLIEYSFKHIMFSTKTTLRYRIPK